MFSPRRHRQAFVLVDAAVDDDTGDRWHDGDAFVSECHRIHQKCAIYPVVFLTQSKLHEIEMLYDRKPVQDVNLGFMEGRFVQPGSEEYVWRAQVDIDDDGVMYLISVWVQHEDDVRSTRRVRRSRRSDMYGFMLKTMVPAARINEMLIMGEHIGQGVRSRLAWEQGGERGSRMNRGGGGRR